MNYINTFFVYSILGHILENFVYTKVDSGILYGYWTPIYGFGCLLILLIDYVVRKKVKNKFLRVFVLFISCALLLGVLELLGGWLIEKVFGRVFWNYSDEPFAIFKYTSLKMMLIWGIASVLFIYIINPYLNIIIKKIPRFVTFTLAFLFIVDLVYTLITISN